MPVSVGPVFFVVSALTVGSTGRAELIDRLLRVVVTVSTSPAPTVAVPVTVGVGLLVVSGFTVGAAGATVSTTRFAVPLVAPAALVAVAVTA